MKYWLLTTEYPPLNGGGISTYCYHTAVMLHQFGNEVTVVVCDNSISKVVEETTEGVRCIRIPMEANHSSYLGNETAWSLSLSNALEQIAERTSAPDIIEAQEYNGIAYIPLQKKLLLSKFFADSTFIITAHAPSFLYLEYNQGPTHEIPYFWTGEMEKSVLKSADGVISPSAYLLDRLDEYVDWPEQHKSVIKNPYRFESTEIPDYKHGEFVFFGKLTLQKGCLEMLDYFSTAWDKGMDCELKVIGGGDHYFYPKMTSMGAFVSRKYKKYIDAGQLTFTGHINPEHINEHLKNAHAVLVPSIVDNLPYTVVESMASGKVVLASTSGGQQELITDGEDGFLFSHDSDGASFISKLEAILTLGEQDVIEMGARAKDKIGQICGYEQVYKEKLAFIEGLPKQPRSEFPFTRIKANSTNAKQPSGKLSVVIPYYNLGEYVGDAIESIQKSDYPEVEIIIVDDGSDKRNTQLLQKFESVNGLQIHTIENGGLSNARNVGAKKATGEFLAFLDADDIVTPTYYTKAINILNRYANVSFVGCWAEYFQDSSISWPSFNPEPPYLLVHNMINTSALVYRKDAFLRHGQNDTSFIYGMEDYDSLMNLVSNRYCGVAIPEKLWKYRIRKESMAQAFNNFSKQFLYRKLAAKYKEFYSEYAEDIVNLLNANGPGYLIENPTRVTRKELKYIHPQLVKMVKQNKFLRPIAMKVYSYLNN